MNTWPKDHSPPSAPETEGAAQAPSKSVDNNPRLNAENIHAKSFAHFSGMARLGLALSTTITILALISVMFLWHNQNQMRAQLTQNLAHLDTQTRDLTLKQQLTAELSEQTRTRSIVLEERLTQWDAQRSRTDAILDALNDSQQDVLVANLRASLQSAQQQAQLWGNVQPLLLALTDAEKRLAMQHQPKLMALHRVVAQDLAHIKTARTVDIVQQINTLDIVLQHLDQLPLQGNIIPSLETVPDTKPVVVAPPQSRWLRLLQYMKENAMQLVRVRTISNTEAALIAPEQTMYVREHLRMRLLNARIALLMRQPDIAHKDIMASNVLLGNYFNTDSSAVKSAQATLRQVQQLAQKNTLPTISDTMQALANAETNVAVSPVTPLSAAGR